MVIRQDVAGEERAGVERWTDANWAVVVLGGVAMVVMTRPQAAPATGARL